MTSAASLLKMRFVTLMLAFTASVLTASVADAAETFADCMTAGGVYTLYSDSPDYDKARRTFSKFSDNWPTAVAYPASTAQVQTAVKGARKADLKVHPRCGNHANEGETVSVGAVTLDLSKMSAVKLSPDMKTFKVQGGAIMGKVIADLWQQSNGTRGFPGGAKMAVGISGFILGGGFGSFHRYAGLGADQIISLQAVDANGNLLDVNATSHADLLWGLRGGGGGKFVVVTEWLLRTMDVTPGQTNFKVLVPYDKAIEAMQFYQRWAVGLPNRFTPRAGIDPESEGSGTRLTYYIGGRYVGNVNETKKALLASGIEASRLFKVDQFDYKFTDYLTNAKASMADLIPAGIKSLSALGSRATYEPEFAYYYKFRSLILDDPLGKEALELLLEFAQMPGTEIEFKVLGGAVSKVPADATAASHMRTGKQLLIIRGTREPTAELQSNPAAAARQILQSSHNATAYIKRVGATVPVIKSYINFRDTDVPAWADYRSAYYGSNLRALECLKARYDPADVFQQPMDIPPPTGSTADCAALLQQVGEKTAAWSRTLLASLKR